MLFFLLLVPVAIGVFGLLKSEGRVTLQEFLVHEVVVIVIVGFGYLIALTSRTHDTEIWNGVVAKKWKEYGSCCHSYPCNCRQECSGSGKSQSCSTVCDTCYLHSHDAEWYAVSSNQETVYSNTCNSPYDPDPARWVQIIVGEPTAVEHGFTNYIKGNPDTILKSTGTKERFKNLIPAYPQVYDLYRAKRLIPVGVNIPNIDALNQKLSVINAELGQPKEVNVTIIVASVADQAYLEAIREAWLGGKKNDLVVVIGTPAFPEISWAGVVSWTKQEEVKIDIRNRLLDLKTFDGDKVLALVANQVANKFVRRPWRDFDYLKSTIEPPTWACWLLFSLGTAISIGLQVFFWREDPFESGYRRYR